MTGYSPNEYLRVVRMKKAAESLLSSENLTVAEVAYKVGSAIRSILVSALRLSLG